MYSRLRLLCVFTFVALPFFLTGCNNMVEIGGKVTYDGLPIQDGIIGFGGNDKAGLVHGAEIKDGSYQMKLPPGTYDVRFQAFEEAKDTVPKPVGYPTPDNVGGKIQILPGQFTMGRTIKREVPKTGGTFDFDLVSTDETPK